MISREIYKLFSLKLNKNDSNEGINILPGVFILLYNIEAKKWLADKLTQDADNVKLTGLESLLISDFELEELDKKDDWVSYKLPDDFYEHASSFALVNKGNCVNQKIFYFEKKPLGFSAILADDSNKAQFEYEEAPFIITKETIKAYVDGYDISSFKFSYYHFPTPIDIAGYRHADGTLSTDVNGELDDYSINEILDRLVLEVQRETENQEGFSYAKDRINTEP